MQENSTTHNRADSELDGHGAEAADDYIELLVRQIVKEVGGPATGSVDSTDRSIDMLQQHLEQLRTEYADQSPSQIAVVSSDRPEVVREDSAVESLVLESVQPEKVQVKQPNPFEQAIVVGEPTGSTRNAPRSKTRKPSADDVILEALSAIGPATSLPIEPRPTRRPPRASMRKGRGRLPMLLVGATVLLICGCAIIVVQSITPNIQEVLENYWVEPETDRAEISEAVLPLALEAPHNDLNHSLSGVTLETENTVNSGELFSRQPIRLPQGDRTITTRTVKTYRVGADGKIFFGPRVGS